MPTARRLEDWWKSDSCEIHHFIGKDITYFHTLFWPGMLKTAGYSLPSKVHIHGFLNVGGKKMSKRDGTLIAAETYLKYAHPSYLRYFYATKLTSRVEDLDLGIDEFTDKVNSDLVGKGRESGQPRREVRSCDRVVGRISRRRRIVRGCRCGWRRDRRSLRVV